MYMRATKPFQHTAARRRLARQMAAMEQAARTFQHTAARRRLGAVFDRANTLGVVSTHSRPKAAGRIFGWHRRERRVSTHSRPKAAGFRRRWGRRAMRRFNTQPPEGGWADIIRLHIAVGGFNTQPPEGGWRRPERMVRRHKVSTHSRPKAAGGCDCQNLFFGAVSTHSRPKAAGCLSEANYD